MKKIILIIISTLLMASYAHSSPQDLPYGHSTLAEQKDDVAYIQSKVNEKLELEPWKTNLLFSTSQTPINTLSQKSSSQSANCPCSSKRNCYGPRGGRYCITSGGNKRYR